jgi:AraC-like DNA-binding protein
MDVHIIPGLKARDVAEAHRKDMLIQDEHECKCMTYWIDEERENVFCLIEAPGKEAVEEMHQRAHGLIPHRIIEVSSDLVQSFLGRIYDPENASVTADGLKVFSDTSFRVILAVSITDPILLKSRIGANETSDFLRTQNEVIRKNFATYSGTEAQQDGPWVIASFRSAAKAVSCARAILAELPVDNREATGLRIAIHAGEPVTQAQELFGSTLRIARIMCSLALQQHIAISSAVKELVSRDYFQEQDLYELSPQDEQFLEQLFSVLESQWQEPGFSIPDFCAAMAMSKSQLYRRTIEITGESPNDLLKDYRLMRAKELMRKNRIPVSQATFDAGFTSPSYFTKCFKKKFGLLPLAYLELLDR